MKLFLFFVVITAVAVFFLFYRPSSKETVPVAATPTPAVVAAAAATPVPPSAPAVPGKHIAPVGTYFLLSPVSMTTDSGVIGIAVGTKVTLLNAKGKTWHVTDGTTPFDVDPDALTNDLDIAAGVIQEEAEKKAALQAGIHNQQEIKEKARQQGAAFLARQIELQRQQQQQSTASSQPGPSATPATSAGGTPPPFGRPHP